MPCPPVTKTVLVGPKWFWSWPFHFGRDQIIMVKSKSIWSDQNCFGHTEGQGMSQVSE